MKKSYVEEPDDPGLEIDLGLAVKVVLWITISVLGIVTGCFGGLLTVVAVGTADSAQAADAWLMLVSQRRIDEAYATTSAMFRTTIEKDEFAEFVDRFAETDYEMRPWRDRYLEVDDRTRYHVELTDSSGAQLPLVVFMAVEDGQWRVYRTVAPQWLVPSDARLQEIVRATIEDIAKAIDEEDFTNLRLKASVGLAQQTTPEILRVLFQDFVDNEVVLVVNAFGEAVFDKQPHMVRQAFGSAVSDVLVAQGYYSLGPPPWEPDPRRGVEVRVGFNFKYVYEDDAWRIWQLDLDLPRVVVLGEEDDAEILTEEEVIVLRLMSEGLHNEQIGRRLVATNRVVDGRVNRILRKLEATSWEQAIRTGIERGLITDPGTDE